jgi:hypothetical protein
VPKLSSSWLEERTMTGPGRAVQHVLQLLQDIGRELAGLNSSLDARVFPADLVFGLVLLLVPVAQAVGGHEDIDQVGAHIVRLGDIQAAAHLLIGSLGQDGGSQHQPGCLAANLAVADLAPADLDQVFDRQPVFGDADIGQLVADDLADQDHLLVLQAVFKGFAQVRRHPLDG